MKIESKDIKRMETAKIIIAKMETDKVYSSHAIQNMFKSLTDPFNDKEDIKKYYTEIRYINDWGEYQWVRPMKKGSEFE